MRTVRRDLRMLHLRAAAMVAAAVAVISGQPAAAQDAGSAALNVSIPVFSAGLPENSPAYAELGIYPRIRAIEAQYLPFALRRRLAGDGGWGVVRVVADASVIEELVVHGEILRSDARQLSVRVHAVDASGTTWLDESFSADPQSDRDVPAYERLFGEVAARLEAARRQQTAEHLSLVRELALLRYGARLAPNTFGQYILESDDGRVDIRRLPARSDPMLDRIRRIREAEYVIIDAADEKYAALHDDVESVYAAWHKFSGKSLVYEAQDERRISDSEPPGPRGSYDALLHAYDNYKYSRQTAEERADMAVAFDNEVRPVIERLDERLDTYDAWLEAKYSEWNRLLEELNEVETRLSN